MHLRFHWADIAQVGTVQVDEGLEQNTCDLWGRWSADSCLEQ